MLSNARLLHIYLLPNLHSNINQAIWTHSLKQHTSYVIYKPSNSYDSWRYLYSRSRGIGW